MHKSFPTDEQIIYSMFGLRQLRNLSCFNACEGGSDENDTRKKFLWGEDAVKLQEERKDKRKSRHIRNYGENNFALYR